MNAKDFFEKHIAELEGRRNALLEDIVNGESAESRSASNEALKAVDSEIASFRSQMSALEERDETAPSSNLNPLETRKAEPKADDAENLEERKAFQRYVARGIKATRSGEPTDTSDVGAAIPQNLVRKIMEKYVQIGEIYNRVTHTRYPVGQTIPVDGLRPVATWVGRNTSSLASSTTGEGLGSTPQKKELGVSISFSHFKLRCEVSFTVEVEKMTISEFEEMFVRQVSEAMIIAKEEAIISGDGHGMPTGILSVTPEAGKALTVKKDGDGNAYLDYATLVALEGAVPGNKESGSKYIMTKKTFTAFLGMTDQVGQPVARVNYGIGGKPERSLLGREVILYEPHDGSKLGSFSETVAVDTIIAAIVDLKDYVLNENYNLGIERKRDWDDENIHVKAVEACDGKLVDITSLVTLTIED